MSQKLWSWLSIKNNPFWASEESVPKKPKSLKQCLQPQKSQNRHLGSTPKINTPHICQYTKLMQSLNLKDPKPKGSSKHLQKIVPFWGFPFPLLVWYGVGVYDEWVGGVRQAGNWCHWSNFIRKKEKSKRMSLMEDQWVGGWWRKQDQTGSRIPLPTNVC